MICSNGHPFDRLSGGQCPICGAGIEIPTSRAKKFEITRANLVVISKALDAARLLAKAATVKWKEAQIVADLVEAGIAQIETLRPKMEYQWPSKPSKPRNELVDNQTRIMQKKTVARTGGRQESQRS